MGKLNGNMYDWISATINPLCGACMHSCKYCYVESLKKRFPVIRNKYSGEIMLDEKVLKKKLGTGKFYFIQSMGDLFAENVSEDMIMRVFDWCSEYPDNTYLFQTKNPARFLLFKDEEYPKNKILCATIESNKDYEGMSKAPCIQERVKAMVELWRRHYRTVITVEPALDFDVHELVTLLRLIKAEWVNIGIDSQGHKLPEPSKEKILELIGELRKFTIVKQKKNLNRLLK